MAPASSRWGRSHHGVRRARYAVRYTMWRPVCAASVNRRVGGMLATIGTDILTAGQTAYSHSTRPPSRPSGCHCACRRQCRSARCPHVRVPGAHRASLGHSAASSPVSGVGPGGVCHVCTCPDAARVGVWAKSVREACQALTPSRSAICPNRVPSRDRRPSGRRVCRGARHRPRRGAARRPARAGLRALTMAARRDRQAIT